MQESSSPERGAVSTSYTPPSWAGTPSITYTLEVTKSGTMVETIDISTKSFYLIGRQPEMCDIVLINPTVSRCHAVLQHGAQRGELYLYDFNSTHGTRVNMQKVQPREFVKLHVGDILLFGFSSRFYLVTGPPEFRTPEYDQVAREVFDETDHEVQIEEETRMIVDTLPIKIQLSPPVTGMKGPKNEDEDEDVEMEDDDQRNVRENFEDQYDDGDEFYDRTQKAAKIKKRKLDQGTPLGNSKTTILNSADITAKIEESTKTQYELENKLNAILDQKAKLTNMAGDSLDSYVRELQISQLSEAELKLRNELQLTLKTKTKFEMLLNIVKPVGQTSLNSLTSLAQPQRKEISTISPDISKPKPQEQPLQAQESSQDVKHHSRPKSRSKSKSPKRLKTKPQTAPTPEFTRHMKKSAVATPDIAREKSDQEKGGLYFYDSKNSDKQQTSSEIQQKTPTSPNTSPRRSPRLLQKAEAHNHADDEDDYEWVPPSDQTGDGRTALNKRLGY